MVNAQIANGYTDEGLITSVGTPITSSNTNNNTTNSTIENLTIQNLSTTMSQSFNIYTFVTTQATPSSRAVIQTFKITIPKTIKLQSIKVNTFGQAMVENTTNDFTTTYYITLNGQNIIGSANNPVYSDKYYEAPYGTSVPVPVIVSSVTNFTLPYSQVLNVNDILECTTINIYGGSNFISFSVTGIEVD